MIENASSDFNCNDTNYPYCYSANNTCDAYWDKMESLTFFFNSNPYTIQPQGYTISNAWDGWACVVAVSYVSDSSNVYVLGDTFLRNFVSVFDY